MCARTCLPLRGREAAGGRWRETAVERRLVCDQRQLSVIVTRLTFVDQRGLLTFAPDEAGVDLRASLCAGAVDGVRRPADGLAPRAGRARRARDRARLQAG